MCTRPLARTPRGPEPSVVGGTEDSATRRSHRARQADGSRVPGEEEFGSCWMIAGGCEQIGPGCQIEDAIALAERILGAV